MSEFNDKTPKNDEKPSENDGEEFVQRFVKVFNESKTYETRSQEPYTQNRDFYQNRMMNAVTMPPLKEEAKMTTLQYQPFREQKKLWREGVTMSIDQSTCKGKSMGMSHKNDSKKKIVRTNTDSEILIPKNEETEDAFPDSSLEDIPGHNEISIVELKERLQEGKLGCS